MHDLPAVQPEVPSVIEAVGNVKGLRYLDLACGIGRCTHLLHTLGASSVHGYDISPTMISGTLTAYSSPLYPTLHFSIADCSKALSPSHEPFNFIFAGWFLNYAGRADELVDMFRVIEENVKEGGRFVGITTNLNDMEMQEPKIGFYGLDVEVLNGEYRAGGEEVLGIRRG